MKVRVITSISVAVVHAVISVLAWSAIFAVGLVNMCHTNCKAIPTFETILSAVAPCLLFPIAWLDPLDFGLATFEGGTRDFFMLALIGSNSILWGASVFLVWHLTAKFSYRNRG